MGDLTERTAQLLDELRHAGGLIDRLVAENEQLRAELAHRDRVLAALRRRAGEDRLLTLVEGGKSRARHIG